MFVDIVLRTVQIRLSKRGRRAGADFAGHGMASNSPVTAGLEIPKSLFESASPDAVDNFSLSSKPAWGKESVVVHWEACASRFFSVLSSAANLVPKSGAEI